VSLSDTMLRRLTWASGAFIVAGALTGATLETLAGQAGEAFFSIFLLTFPAVGFVVVSRRPRATLGWLMVSMGFVAALPLTAYGHFALERDLPLGPLAFALGAPGWVPFIGISGYLLLLFPDGHLPSPRWRWFSWICGIGMGLIAVFIWFAPGTFADDGYPEVVNPIGIAALKPIVNSLTPLTLFAPILVVGGAVALVVRFRRSSDDVVRHQIRWLAWAASWIAFLFILSFLPGAGDSSWNSWIQNLAALSFVLIPITIGIAVLRYRLYDIDVVIRKTVVIAVMVGFIALVYVAVVAGIGALVGARSSPLLSALAAAIVALVFQPARARARRFADRIVYGKRATPYEVMTTFGDQLAGTYATDDVLPRTARVLGEGVGAERAEVRMAFGDEMRAVATWPPGAPEVADDHVVEVRHQGELLGALAVSLPANDPLDPTREQLMQDLAAQAGLVLRNERLTQQLRTRLEQLQGAQKRLVAAQDEERRKLERNIHDGAQQQLVALTVKLRLAQGFLGKDPARAETMLIGLQADTQGALEDLRDLARGIYPPLLADKGLPTALESQLRKSVVLATLHADAVRRYPQEIEAAVYFSCLEALQNTAKYAQASTASVQLSEIAGLLEFRVTDDGVGFDPASIGYGTGLQGIADRLGAIEGEFRIESSPGRGTTVIGRVPCAAAADAPVSPRQEAPV
jgi:signal transduction histidine kinase